jgi:MFS family permease
VFAGSSYVLGFTLLHENVEDELRGRVFAGTYILVRVCVLLSMAIGPMLLDPLDGVSKLLFGDDRSIDLGFEISVPGVRLTLWLAGVVMLVASALAALSLRNARTRQAPSETTPSDGSLSGASRAEPSAGSSGPVGPAGPTESATA